jgi:hypothetical protein
VLPRVLVALERHGRHREAERLRAEVGMIFHGEEGSRGWGPPKMEVAMRLPPSCPGCGAPIRPNEVAWVGPESAECPYCGAVVSAEG